MKKSYFFVFGLFLSFYQILAQTPEWHHIPGPDGGTVYNLDLDGDILYGLTPSGIYHSNDEGYHWQLDTSSLNTTRDKNYLQVENGVFFAMNNITLDRSEDDGASWQTILQNPFPLNFEAEYIQTFLAKGDTLLVGSLYTIYRSTDKGETWTSTVDLAPDPSISLFEFKNEFFAARDHNIYRSTDGGSSWETVFTSGIGFTTVTATDSFIIGFYGDKSRLLRSKDGLRSWDVIATDTLADFFDDYPYEVWADGVGSKLYYFEGNISSLQCPIRFCYSEDGGNTWHRGNDGNAIKIGWALRGGEIFENHIVVASTQINHSVDNGHTFTEQQTGLKSSIIYRVISKDSSIFLYTNPSANHSSLDGGQTWVTFSNSDALNLDCDTYAWMNATQERVFRYQDQAFEKFYTQDAGLSWNVLETPDYYYSEATDHTLWLISYVWQTTNYQYYFWKSDDANPAFVPIHLFDFSSQDHVSNILSLGDRLAVVFYNKFLIFDEQGKLILELPKSPCLQAFQWPGNLYFNGDTYFNFCGDRCYIFPPNATAWQQIYPQDWTTGIPLYHNTMVFFETYKGINWVGLDGKGLFYSTDNSGRFYPVEPQLPFPHPTSIDFNENTLFVGTDGGGVWTYTLPQAPPNLSKNEIFKVFPNPSNGAINLESKEFIKDVITLSVLDASGREVAQKVLNPGLNWSLDFPGQPKGLYFLQLRTESGVFGLKWVIEP